MAWGAGPSTPGVAYYTERPALGCPQVNAQPTPSGPRGGDGKVARLRSQASRHARREPPCTPPLSVGASAGAGRGTRRQASPDESLSRVVVELEVERVVVPQEPRSSTLRQPGLWSPRRVAARGAALRDVIGGFPDSAVPARAPSRRPSARAAWRAQPLRDEAGRAI